MTLRMGIVGLGFMGKMHFDVYGRMKNARVVAICDDDARKRRGDWSSIAGNIGGAGGRQDLSGVRTCSRLDQLLSDDDVDVVDITLPTNLHAEVALAALKAGKHVFCDKPMARTSGQCRKVTAAARRARRRIFVGHCIRFWPGYAEARKMVKSGLYGKVLSAAFNRFSCTPTWSYRNWLQDPVKSGLCALDLHIHDADFVLYLFGKPKSVTSRGSGFSKGRLDHIVTSYEYRDNMLVTAEAGWEYPAAFPFSMSFRIVMEKATLDYGADGLLLYPPKGKPKKVKTATRDGYESELRHFVDCVEKNRASTVVTPASATQSVILIEAETASALSGRTVKPRL